MELYKFHCVERGGPPSIMRHPLCQQLLRQDPELYRLAVTPRTDGIWKLLGIPTRMNGAIRSPDNTFPKLVQLGVQQTRPSTSILAWRLAARQERNRRRKLCGHQYIDAELREIMDEKHGKMGMNMEQYKATRSSSRNMSTIQS